MKNLMILMVVLSALTGCSTIQGKLDNRVACAVGKDKAFLVSEYGPVGISATISNKDASVICK